MFLSLHPYTKAEDAADGEAAPMDADGAAPEAEADGATPMQADDLD